MKESNYSHLDEKPQFWFNLKTLKVELGPKSNSENRVGPFETEAEARGALDLIRRRSESWANEDAEEN